MLTTRFSHGRRDRDVRYVLRSHDFQRALRKLGVHAVAFPLSSPPFPPRYFLIRTSFANKENVTARGCGLDF